jgi:hypothetical protein
MGEIKKFYVGSAKETSKEGFVLELNVSQLKEALKDESVQEKMHTFMSKVTGENKTIKILIAAMKEESQTKWRTHSAKVINWDSEQFKKPEEPNHVENEEWEL